MKKIKTTFKGFLPKEPHQIVSGDRSASNTSLTSSFELNAIDDGDQSRDREVRFLQMKLEGKEKLEHILRNQVQQEKTKYAELEIQFRQEVYRLEVQMRAKESKIDTLESLVNQLSSSLEEEKNQKQHLDIEHEQQNVAQDLDMRQELLQLDLRMKAMAAENDCLKQRNEQLSTALASEKRKRKQLQKDYVRHCVEEERIINIEALVKFIASKNGYDSDHLPADIRGVLAKMEKLVGQDWISLGLALGVKSETLDVISRSRATLTGKHQQLIREWTLQDSDCSASRLVKALQSIGLDPFCVFQMPDNEKDCLEKHRKLLVENLTPVCINSICDKLYELGVIRMRTKEVILREQTLEERVVSLVLSLQYSGAGTLQTFCDVLRGCGCGFIADTIQASGKTETDDMMSGTFNPDSEVTEKACSDMPQTIREGVPHQQVPGQECTSDQNVSLETSVSGTTETGKHESWGFDCVMGELIETTNELSLSKLEELQGCQHAIQSGSPVVCKHFTPLLVKCIKTFFELQRHDGSTSGHLDHDQKKIKYATLKSFLLSLLDHVGILDNSLLPQQLDLNVQCMTLLDKLMFYLDSTCGHNGQKEESFPHKTADSSGEETKSGEGERNYWTFRRPSGNILQV